MPKIFITILFFFISFNINASEENPIITTLKIQDISHLQKLFSNLTKHDLVVINVDNSVIAPTESIFKNCPNNKYKNLIDDLKIAAKNDNNNKLALSDWYQKRLYDLPSQKTVDTINIIKKNSNILGYNELNSEALGKINNFSDHLNNELTNLKVSFSKIKTLEEFKNDNFSIKHNIIFANYYPLKDIIKILQKELKFNKLVWIDTNKSRLKEIAHIAENLKFNLTAIDYDYKLHENCRMNITICAKQKKTLLNDNIWLTEPELLKYYNFQ